MPVVLESKVKRQGKKNFYRKEHAERPEDAS